MRSTLVRKTSIAALCGLLLPALSGCTMVSWTGPGGERLSRRSFGATTSLSSLWVEVTTNGLRRIQVRGYLEPI